MNDDQSMSSTKEEYQSHNGKQEALSSLHKAILQNNTQLEPSDIEDQKSLLKEEVETSSVLLSPDIHKIVVVSADNIENTLSDSHNMEVEDVPDVMHGCMGSTRSQTAKSGIENGHSVESSLENDGTQTEVEIPLINQNGDRTELEDTKTTNNLKNLLENSDLQQHVESELVHANSVQSAECETSQVQSNVPLASNVKRISTLHVNYDKSDSIENKKSKSSVPPEMKTVTDISTHDIQSRLADKADQSEEDNNPKSIGYQKSLDVRKKGGACSSRPSKDEESSSEDKGLFGLMRKFRGVHSRSEGRIPSEELDNVSSNMQCSTAKQMSKDEPQEIISENRELSHSGLSAVIIESEDENDSECPENDKTVQNVCKLLSLEIQFNDTKDKESESPRKTLVQMKTESYQKVDGMSADTHSPGVENVVCDIYNNKAMSGDSAVDSLEETRTPCQGTLDPEYSTFEKMWQYFTCSRS